MAFDWSPDWQQAFAALKDCLSQAPIMAYPKDEGLPILDKDVSQDTDILLTIDQPQR